MITSRNENKEEEKAYFYRKSIVHYAIERSLLNLGYRPECLGMCAAYTHLGIQAFLSGEVETYLKKLVTLIENRANKSFYSKIKKDLRDYKDSKQPSEDQQFALDLKTSMECMMIAQIPQRYPYLFRNPVRQWQHKTIFKMLSSNKLDHLGGVSEIADSNIKFSSDFKKQLLILDTALKTININIALYLNVSEGSLRHVIGLCYDATKGWYDFDDLDIKRQGDQIFPCYKPISSIDFGFWESDEDNFRFYFLKKDKEKAKKLFLAFKEQWVKYLAEKKNIRDQTDKALTENAHPLLAAINEEKLDEIESFFKNGTDVNTCLLFRRNLQPHRWSIAMFAAYRGKKNVLELLERYQANFNLSPMNDENALFLAAYSNHLDALKLLTKYKEHLNQAVNTFDGLTPLFAAVNNNSLECVKILVESGVDINYKLSFRYKCTAIFHAADRGYIDIIEYLASHGANLEITNQNNETPLYLAVSRGNVEVFEVLAKYGADLNFVKVNEFSGEEEGSILQIAIERSELDIIKIMEKYHVDFTKALPNGHTPLEYARKCEHDLLIEYFELQIQQDVAANPLPRV